VTASPLVIPAGQTSGVITGTVINGGVYGGAFDKTLTVTLGRAHGRRPRIAVDQHADHHGKPRPGPLPPSPARRNRNATFQALYQKRFGAAGHQGRARFLGRRAETAPAARQRSSRALENSTEAKTNLVSSWYEQFLGRAPSNGEEQGWVHLLQSGASEETALSAIMGSQEFFDRAQSLVATGSPNERFVQSVYQIVLHRSGSASDGLRLGCRPAVRGPAPEWCLPS